MSAYATLACLLVFTVGLWLLTKRRAPTESEAVEFQSWTVLGGELLLTYKSGAQFVGRMTKWKHWPTRAPCSLDTANRCAVDAWAIEWGLRNDQQERLGAS